MTGLKKHAHFRLKMPGAFVILFLLTVIAVLATWFVPAGSYSKLSYDQPSKQLKVHVPDGPLINYLLPKIH